MAASQTAQPALTPEISALAAQRNLGEPIDRRGNGNPLVRALVLIATALVGFALFWVLTLPGWKPLVFIGLIPLAYGIVTPIWAVILLVRGFQQTFLYQGGLVAVKNGKARAAAWSDVTGMEVLVFGEGALFSGRTSAYLVKLANGSPIRIGSTEIVLPDGQSDPFGARVIEMVQAAGRPVTRRVVHGKDR